MVWVFGILKNKLGDSVYNIGSGSDISINNLSELIKNIVGFEGDVLWDQTKPDGTMRKILDSSKIRNLGWKPKIKLETGIDNLYDWFLNNYKTIKQNKIK